MPEYQRLSVLLPSKTVANDTSSRPESTFYAAFKPSPTLIKEPSAITHLDFSPTCKELAVASGSRVQIYSNQAFFTLQKTISRFKGIVYSPKYRSDGTLLVAGDSTGLIQMFNLASRAILRTFNGHQGPVQWTDFMNDKTHLLSASDDKTVRFWDIPSQTAIQTWEEHQDYVRTAAYSPEGNLFFSGSYDHTVKLWDTRSPTSVLTWNTEAPVEALQLLPGSSLLAVASGPTVQLYDILGSKLFHTWSNHSKTVTSLAVHQNNTTSSAELLTGSLDHHLKVYSLEDYTVVHSQKYSAPILSLDIAQNGNAMAVGMGNGLLSLQSHKTLKKSSLSMMPSSTPAPRRGSKAYFMRGSSHKGQEEDIIIDSSKKKKLAAYDKYLKSFQYGAALDAVMNKDVAASIAISMIKELIYRDGLVIALGGRNEQSLEPILNFIHRNIIQPSYTSLLLDLSQLVLDLYEPVANQSFIIHELLVKLKQRMDEQLGALKRMHQVLGLLQCLTA